jgi:hypothetical protein
MNQQAISKPGGPSVLHTNLSPDIVLQPAALQRYLQRKSRCALHTLPNLKMMSQFPILMAEKEVTCMLCKTAFSRLLRISKRLDSNAPPHPGVQRLLEKPHDSPVFLLIKVELRQRWVWRICGIMLTAKHQALRGKLSQCHFVHHICDMAWPGIESRPPRWKAGYNTTQDKKLANKTNLNYIWRFRSYRAVNAPRLGCNKRGNVRKT